MAITTETIPFNFDELYAGLETKFAEKGYDISEGSNTAQLITAMAYLTSMLNTNTAVNINETLLPLATKRKTALQDARALGYETSHTQSYKYLIKIALSAGNHIIPKYSKFTAEGKDYYYMGNRLEYENVPEGYEIELIVKEGTLHKFENNPDTLIITTSSYIDANGDEVPQYYIDVPYIDVENDGIEVFLTYYDEFGNLHTREQWYQSKQFMIDADTILDREFIRLDDIDFRTPRLYFTISGVGLGIRTGSIVEMNVLTSSGTEGGLSDMATAKFVHNIGDAGIVVSGVSRLEAEGTDDESIASIKQNAPMFHNSANRAVTKNDYEAIANKQGSVETSIVWGGDDEYPKAPGHVWFSFEPSALIRSFTSDTFKTEFTLDIPEDIENWFIQDKEIRSTEFTVDGQVVNPGVWDVLDDYKIPTLEFQNRHPIYLDFEYDLQLLKYNIKTSKADIHQDVFNVIDNIFTGTNDSLMLEDFEVEYFHSNVEKRIDQNITDVTGFNNTLTTKLMLTRKNVSVENALQMYNDIYIPMAVPYEKYFNNAGELISSVMPSIDTSSFINETGINIYTDWSVVTGDVSSDSLIIAPIRANQTETITMVSAISQVTLSDVKIWPDYHDVDELEYTYDLITVKVNGVETAYTRNNESQITFASALSVGDVVEVTVNNHVGYYHLFNNYKKLIIAQLFVDGSTYAASTSGDGGLFNEPKSYLTTTDGFYGFTTDAYYITTEGFVVQGEEELTAITGNIIRAVTPELYTMSSLKRELFDTPRYMNFNYASPNFRVYKNIIPRLKSVTFQ